MFPIGKIIPFVLIGFWISQAHAQKAAIQLEPMNILYIGLKTPVRIVVEGKKDSEIVTRISQGCIITKENHQYYLTADGSNGPISVEVGYLTVKRDTIWVDTFEFRVRKLPRPEILLGPKTPGYISKNEIATISMINAGLGEGFAYEGVKFTVVSYNILCLDEQNFYMENNMGNQISYRCRQNLNKLQPGANIIISKIKIRNEKTNTETELNNSWIWKISPENEISIPEKVKITGFISVNMNTKPFDLIVNTEFYAGQVVFPQGSKEGEWNVYEINKDGLKTKWQTVNFKNDSIISIKSFYSNGKPKCEKIPDLISSYRSYTSFFKSGGIFLKGKFLIHSFPYFYNIVDDSMFKKNSLSFITGQQRDTTYSTINELLFGPWEQYYPNGNLKEKGAFDTTFENQWWIVCKFPMPIDPDDPYTFEDDTTCFSVRNGPWEFYDEKGQKTIVKYNKGHIVKE
jgi:hypothetical protein